MTGFGGRLGDRWQRLLRNVMPASQGAGPLLQRDYWAVVEASRLRPSEVAALVAREFEAFAPEELVRFARTCEPGRALAVGDELDIEIRMAGECGVRVVHTDACSLTLATLEGHPEAGRITFGAYRNEQGDVVFHIRSRARASDRARYLGFLMMGEAMQTNTWVDFTNAVANRAGTGVRGEIHASTEEIDDEPPEAAALPTFLARAD
jgi:hypothetical protein